MFFNAAEDTCSLKPASLPSGENALWYNAVSQLIITTEELQRIIDQKKQLVHVIILDFSKASDTVAHNKLISKLQNYAIQGKTNKCINKWLKFRNQKVVLDGEMSDPVPCSHFRGATRNSSRPSYVPPLHQWHQPQHKFKKYFFCRWLRTLHINKFIIRLFRTSTKSSEISWLVSHMANVFNINKCHTLHTHKKPINTPAQWTTHR